jgi:hypothetical protein
MASPSFLIVNGGTHVGGRIHVGGAAGEESAVGEDVPDVRGSPRDDGALQTARVTRGGFVKEVRRSRRADSPVRKTERSVSWRLENAHPRRRLKDMPITAPL